MTQNQWRTKIRAQMKAAGTYQEYFSSSVDALAKILEQRDRAYKNFVDGGAQITIVYISDRGSRNEKKNPLLQAWSDLNKDALAYYRDLGLTPAGLKRLNEEALKGEEGKKGLVDALSELGI